MKFNAVIECNLCHLIIHSEFNDLNEAYEWIVEKLGKVKDRVDCAYIEMTK